MGKNIIKAVKDDGNIVLPTMLEHKEIGDFSTWRR